MSLIVFGAAGCAKEVEWLIHDINQTLDKPQSIQAFLDVNPAETEFIGYPLFDENFFLNKLKVDSAHSFILAIANAKIRWKLFQNLKIKFPNSVWPTFIHPDAHIDNRPSRGSIGQGTCICAGAHVMPDTYIGEVSYVSLNVSIGHDCQIDSSFIAFPLASVSGNCKIGKRVTLGTGARIKEGITICDDVFIGAGAVVVKDILEPGTFIGVPTKKCKAWRLYFMGKCFLNGVEE